MSRLPLSHDSQYPSMAAQLRGADIRSIIQLQQRESILYRQKMETEIAKTLQLIKNHGLSLQEAGIRLKSLKAEEFNAKEQTRDVIRMMNNFKQGTYRVGAEIDQQKSGIVKERFTMGDDYDQHLKHKSAIYETEIEGFNIEKQTVENSLNNLLNQKLEQKRLGRQRLVEMEQDILLTQLNRESMEIEIITNIAYRQTKKYDELFRQIEIKVTDDQNMVSALKRKSQYLYKQLEEASLKTIDQTARFEADIAELQTKVKNLHDDMTKINMDIQTKNTQMQLMEAEVEEKQQAVAFRRNHIGNTITKGNTQLDLVRFQVQEQRKTASMGGQRVYQRILQLEKAVRTQQGNNKGIKSQYDKLCNMLVVGCQGAVRSSMNLAAPDITRMSYQYMS